MIKIARAGVIIGEYPPSDIPALVRAKVILPTDDYWTAGMAGWSKVSSLASGSQSAIQQPPALPPQGRAVNSQQPAASRNILWIVMAGAGCVVAAAFFIYPMAGRLTSPTEQQPKAQAATGGSASSLSSSAVTTPKGNTITQRNGDPISVTEKRTFSDLLDKAQRGDADAQFKLGICYADGLGVEVNAAEAVKWYRKSAEQGNAMAQLNIGICFREGNGVPEDKAESEKWFRMFQESRIKAYLGFFEKAKAGDAHAQAMLGFCYATGFGVEEDKVEAKKWYGKSADQGNADGQFYLAMALKNDDGTPSALAILPSLKSAEQGNAQAQLWLGISCSTGNIIAAKDVDEAAAWFRKSAEQGNAQAQFYLAVAYLKGDGVEEDKTKAVSWLRKSAEQGEVKAMAILAVSYYNGEGVEKDAVEAVKWYRKVAKSGDSSEETKMRAAAQNHLGDCYVLGRGVSKDLIEAYAYYSLSADANEDSREGLVNMKKILSPESLAAGRKRVKELREEIKFTGRRMQHRKEQLETNAKLANKSPSR